MKHHNLAAGEGFSPKSILYNTIKRRKGAIGFYYLFVCRGLPLFLATRWAANLQIVGLYIIVPSHCGAQSFVIRLIGYGYNLRLFERMAPFGELIGRSKKGENNTCLCGELLYKLPQITSMICIAINIDQRAFGESLQGLRVRLSALICQRIVCLRGDAHLA